jgi:glycosyltransferase domain-containing protein
MPELLEDPEAFSVVMPTFEGGRFYRRTFEYFSAVGYRGRIAVCDDSSGAHRAFIERCQETYPELGIDLFLYPHPTPFLEKLTDTLHRIQSRFVMLHAQDDFMIPEAVVECVNLLATHPDYMAARGRVAMFQLERNAAGAVDTHLVPHPMREYLQDDPLARVLAHLERYTSTFYSVHRRESLRAALAYTRERNDNVIFFQYLSSALVALQGKIACTDQLFYCRQGHAESWSATLKQDSYAHWPLLITDPGFSGLYATFRSALVDWVSSHLGTLPADFGARFDRAAVQLFRRGFCGIEAENPQEVAFLRQLQQRGTPASEGLRRIVEFASGYPETYVAGKA